MMSTTSNRRGSRNPLRENSSHSLRYNNFISPESCLLSGIKSKRERRVEMKENMSANNTERILKRWDPISIDIECEKPSDIVEETSEETSCRR